MFEKIAGDLKTILRGNVLILFTTWVLLSFGNNMVHKFDGLYFKALGATDVWLGYMGAITFGMMALLQIPGGHVADTFGRKKVIVVFTFVMAFSMLIFAFAPSWQYILIGLIIANVSLLYQPALFSIVMDSLPSNRRAEGFAVTNLSSLPALFAPIVGGALIYYFGLVPGMRLGYFILFILSLSAAFLRFFLKETVPAVKRKRRDGFLSFFRVIKSVDPRAKYLIVVAMLMFSSTGMIGYFVVLYSSTYTSSLIFGVIMGVGMFVSTLSGVFVGKMGDIKGKEKFYITGMLLTSISLALFIFPNVLSLLEFAVISGLGMAFYQPSTNGLIADLVPLEKRGRFTGMYLFSSYMVAMIFTTFAGYIYAYNPQILFIIASFLSLIAAVVGYIFILHPIVGHNNGYFSQKS